MYVMGSIQDELLALTVAVIGGAALIGIVTILLAAWLWRMK